MSQTVAVVDELELALKTSSTEKHIAILKRVTDLFVASQDKITEELSSVFNDVIVRLIDHVESRALVELSAQLGPVAKAPADAIHRLASHDDIAVAGPVLAHSPCLSDQHLVQFARSKSQAHLGKIAERSQLSPTITDVLVDRGDREVVSKVAANAGASFSRTGMSMLVMRANGDDQLTHAVGQRADIPPALFKQLLSHATERVRQHLLGNSKPETRDAINRVLSQIAEQMGTKKVSKKDYLTAQQLVHSFSQDTAVTRSKVLEFADGNRIAELVAALSILSGLPIAHTGRLICESEPFGTMMLCKAIRLDWSTAHAVLNSLPGKTADREAQIEQMCDQFERLSPSSAQRLLGFWQARQTIPAPA